MGLPSTAPVSRTPSLSSPTAARWATASTRSKLRDSCQACAVSKVKCHKEKPRCSRCARRDLSCEYFVTKRPGRKRRSTSTSTPSTNDSNNDPINVTRRQSTVSSTDAATRSGSSDDLVTAHLSPTSPRLSKESGTESAWDLSSGLLVPLKPSLSSTLTGLSGEFDFDTSPIDFFGLDALDPIHFTADGNDVAQLVLPDGIHLDHAFDPSSRDRRHASKPSSPADGRSLSTSYRSVTGAVKPTGCCLMQALEYMKEFSSTMLPACARSQSLSRSLTTTSPMDRNRHPSAQAVVRENQQTIEAVSNMSQCSCAEDAYVLTMLAMIVFQILGRYAAAARKPPDATEEPERPDRNPSPHEQRRRLGRYYPDDDDRERTAAQLILSELHRVQRLINQLSPRLKTRGRGASGPGGGMAGVGANDAGGDRPLLSRSDGERAPAPFSASTLEHIEIDLRQRLSSVSAEIISMLQQS